MEIKPIAYIHNCFTDKFGIPRQSGRASSVESVIVFEPEYRSPEALREIEGFSHLWLIFGFSEAEYTKFSPTVRPPRLGGNRRVGVFASRSPYRPNSLGLSSVELVGLRRGADGDAELVVRGADLLDGTPIYDVKPYLAFSDSHPDAKCGYAEAPKNHHLDVSDPDCLLDVLPDALKAAALECLGDDPRPSYIDDPERVFAMTLSDYDVSFTVRDGTACVRGVERKTQKKSETRTDGKND